jgi:hypothetical protein
MKSSSSLSLKSSRFPTSSIEGGGYRIGVTAGRSCITALGTGVGIGVGALGVGAGVGAGEGKARTAVLRAGTLGTGALKVGARGVEVVGVGHQEAGALGCSCGQVSRSCKPVKRELADEQKCIE